jgi:hypothetical protein
MKIWFDKEDINFSSFCSEQFLLLPFFDDSVLEKDNDFKNGKKWKTSLEKYISLSNKEDCDAFVFPEKLNHNIGKYIFEARRQNKKILAFFNDDYDKPSCLDERVKLYRTSLLKSKQRKNEFAMPAWSQDFNDIAPFTARNKDSKPTVGFCGFFSNSLRRECIELLNKNNSIKTNFIIRDSFWGGQPHNKTLRGEYINNIINSDFILCVRGAGNFSYRLYEALSCGRIPIFVNTDCVLPCEDKINWRDLCVFIDDINTINIKINEFWQKISISEYVNKQQEARNIYESYLAPDGFAQYISYNI